MNPRARVLDLRGLCLAEAARLEVPDSAPTTPDLLRSIAGELEDVARAMADRGWIELDGIASDGPSDEPTPEELEDLIKTQPIYPLPPRARPKA